MLDISCETALSNQQGEQRCFRQVEPDMTERHSPYDQVASGAKPLTLTNATEGWSLLRLCLPYSTVRAPQMGFGDVQVPGPLAPPVPEATSEGARVAAEVDLTHIPQPPGTPVPLSVCADRAHRHDHLSSTSCDVAMACRTMRIGCAKSACSCSPEAVARRREYQDARGLRMHLFCGELSSAGALRQRSAFAAAVRR